MAKTTGIWPQRIRPPRNAGSSRQKRRSRSESRQNRDGQQERGCRRAAGYYRRQIGRVPFTLSGRVVAIAQLAGQHVVIAPDLRGAGGSAKPAAGSTCRRLAAIGDLQVGPLGRRSGLAFALLGQALEDLGDDGQAGRAFLRQRAAGHRRHPPSASCGHGSPAAGGSRPASAPRSAHPAPTRTAIRESVA